MKAWMRRLRREVRRLSWTWLAALGLACAAAALYYAGVRPAERELAALERGAAELQAQQRLGAERGARQDPRVQLARFYAHFPAGASAPNWLERIHDAARAHRLDLMQGDYRLARSGQGQLARYQVTLPLQGSYPNIRGFLNAVLSEVPAASLDQVAFERQKIGEDAVRVTVRLTLYLRGTS